MSFYRVVFECCLFLWYNVVLLHNFSFCFALFSVLRLDFFAKLFSFPNSDPALKPENPYSCILKMRGQVWGSQKMININTNHSFHHVYLPKPVSTDLTKKSDSFLTNPIGKHGVFLSKAGRCSKISNLQGIFIVTASLEGWSTKAEEAPPHELRLALLDNSPAF